MIKPKLEWFEADAVGAAVFPQGFDEQDWVLKADALQDWIHDLQAKYNSLFTDEERNRK